ncbi:MAG: hypothetical protein ACX93N_05800 [Pseudohaliea sp.]
MLRKIAALLVAFVVALSVTYLIGSVVATQFVLREVAALGPAVPWSVRLETSAQDLAGLAGSYLPLLALAFLLALPVAAGLSRLRPAARPAWYLAAGFVAVLALHLIMKAVLGVSGIAATRSFAGLLAQGAAGAVGGALFHALTAGRRPPVPHGAGEHCSRPSGK